MSSLTEGAGTIQIVERASVKPGGVVIETNAGQLDARLEEQLEAVTAAFKPKWSAPEPSAEDHSPADV